MRRTAKHEIITNSTNVKRQNYGYGKRKDNARKPAFRSDVWKNYRRSKQVNREWEISNKMWYDSLQINMKYCEIHFLKIIEGQRH